ncbi:hypothetical protein D9M72_422020 [compost metagenome]
MSLFDQRLAHVGARENVVLVGLERALVVLHAEFHAAGLAVGIAEIVEDAGALLVLDRAEYLDGIFILAGIGELAGGLEQDIVAEVAFLGVDAGILLCVPHLAIRAFAGRLGLLGRFAGVFAGCHHGLRHEAGCAGHNQGAKQGLSVHHAISRSSRMPLKARASFQNDRVSLTLRKEVSRRRAASATKHARRQCTPPAGGARLGYDA